MKTIESKDLDSHFKFDVAVHSGGENIKLCFACGTCTAGCPVAGIDPDFNPRTIIRQVLLGMRKEVLSSPAIWRCIQCYSCTEKCPQNVKFREIIRALREMAVKEGYVDAALPEQVEDLALFSQELRNSILTVLLADNRKYEELKAKLKTTIA